MYIVKMCISFLLQKKFKARTTRDMRHLLSRLLACGRMLAIATDR